MGNGHYRGRRALPLQRVTIFCMQQVHMDSLARICEEHAGWACEVQAIEELVGPHWGRSTIWRCAYVGQDRLQHTVIAKYSNLGAGHGANESAILSRLNCQTELEGHLPRLLGYDAQLGLLVLSDLGDLRNQHLADWRDRLSHEQWIECLRDLMGLVGSLNRLNPADDPHWRDFPPINPTTDVTKHAAVHFEESIELLPERFQAFEISLHDTALAELAEMKRELFSPQRYCLTHADICPSNVALLDGNLLIFDFEVANLRHPAIDAAWPRMRALRCFHCTILQEPLVSELEQAWASGFAWQDSALAVECSFGVLISAGCAAWLAAMLTWLPYLMEKDRERERVPDRTRIIAVLEAMAGCDAAYGCLPGFALACRSLRERLLQAWPGSALQNRPV